MQINLDGLMSVAVRKRPLINKILRERRPDVVCLSELKKSNFEMWQPAPIVADDWFLGYAFVSSGCRTAVLIRSTISYTTISFPPSAAPNTEIFHCTPCSWTAEVIRSASVLYTALRARIWTTFLISSVTCSPGRSPLSTSSSVAILMHATRTGVTRGLLPPATRWRSTYHTASTSSSIMPFPPPCVAPRSICRWSPATRSAACGRGKRFR